MKPQICLNEFANTRCAKGVFYCLSIARQLARLSLVVIVLAIAGFVTQAHANPEPDENASLVGLIGAIQEAARTTDYEGFFTYQHGTQLKTSRIVHMVDGTGERERLEVLDGSPREFLRHNSSVQCLVPDKKLVVIQEQRHDRFPGFLVGSPQTISASYTHKVQEQMGRVAGRDCKVIDILPKDSYRYGYRICVDTDTNLLLKSQTLDNTGAVVDQVAFNTLKLGSDVVAERLESRWNTKNWEVVELAPEPVDAAALGWHFALPPGFVVNEQVSRSLRSGEQAIQLVLDDGLAVVSLFLEPYSGSGGKQKMSGQPYHEGVTAVYRDRIADYWATAIGEVPIDTLRYLIEHTEYLPNKSFTQ